MRLLLSTYESLSKWKEKPPKRKYEKYISWILIQVKFDETEILDKNK